MDWMSQRWYFNNRKSIHNGAVLCIIGLVAATASQKKEDIHEGGEKVWRNVKK